MSPLRQESHVARNVATPTLRSQPVSVAMTRAYHAADSADGSQSRSHIGQDDQSPRPSRHGIVGSSLISRRTQRTPINPSPDRLATNEPNHREDNTVQEMLSSSEFPWIQTLNGQRRAASGIRNGHGIGVASSLNRSASYGDLQNDVEYVTIQRVQRLDQVPLHMRQGVFRLENVHRNRILRRHSINQYATPVEDDQVDDSIEPPMDPEFEEDDFETASDIISDRDSSFTSSIAAPFAGSRANSFRFHEDGTTSPVSISATQDQPESVVNSFGGYERLYDISSQIEAAMDQIERLSMQPGRSRPTESQTPVTPFTHRSCYQLSDEEEDDEDLEWNSRVRDAVFIVDDLETDSDSDADSVSFSPYDDVDAAMHTMTDTPRISSVEESYYY